MRGALPDAAADRGFPMPLQLALLCRGEGQRARPEMAGRVPKGSHLLGRALVFLDCRLQPIARCAQLLKAQLMTYNWQQGRHVPTGAARVFSPRISQARDLCIGPERRSYARVLQERGYEENKLAKVNVER
jgi:hypothetical protein